MNRYNLTLYMIILIGLIGSINATASKTESGTKLRPGSFINPPQAVKVPPEVTGYAHSLIVVPPGAGRTPAFYEVQQSVYGTTVWKTPKHTVTNIINFTINDIAPGRYVYRVRSCITGMCSRWLITRNVTVNGIAPPAPLEITYPPFFTRDTHDLKLEVEAENNATFYEIEYLSKKSVRWITPQYTKITQTHYRITNVEPLQRKYRARACNSDSCSDWIEGFWMQPGYGVSVSKVKGNTSAINSIAEFDVSLLSQPSSNVVIPLRSTDTSEGQVMVNQLVFTPDNWAVPQLVQVEGRNPNVVDGRQNYRIELQTIQSSDPLYNGIDPEDAHMAGLDLYLGRANRNEVNFIPGLEARIYPNVDYTGYEKLTYELLKGPTGMTINPATGVITWKPLSFDQGKVFSVEVQVTDGQLFKKTDYSVSAVVPIVLKREIITANKKHNVTITEPNSNLRGVSFTFDQYSSIPSVQIKKVPENSWPEIPPHIVRLSDVFLIQEPNAKNITVRMPLNGVSENDYYEVRLFSLVEEVHSERPFWISVGYDEQLSILRSGGEKQYSIDRLNGVYFIGLKRITPASSVTIKSPSPVFSNVSCSPKNGRYTRILCTIGDSKIKILDFATSANQTRWQGTTVEELATWVHSAQTAAGSLGLSYDKNITVEITQFENPKVQGRFIRGWLKNTSKFYLTSNEETKTLMKGATLHEFFHHAQYTSTQSGRDRLIEAPGRKSHWFIEGTARWFEDYSTQFDSLNSYREAELKGKRILESGLAAVPNSNNVSTRAYQRFTFFKLLESRCPGFVQNLRNMLNIDQSTDPNGVRNFLAVLGRSGCRFGNHLGAAKSSSIEAAILYYQYATIMEKDISKLDANEDKTKFSFYHWGYGTDNSKWQTINNVKQIQMHSIAKIPAYGAYSVYTNPNTWTAVGQNKEAVLRVTTNSGSNPLLVSMLTKWSGFIGDSTLDGWQHKSYYTSDQSEYIFAQSDLKPLHITLVNPTGQDIDVGEVTFEIRDKLHPPVNIIAPANNGFENRRVTSVVGSIPSGATDVDRVIVSNGTFKTIAAVAANGSFSADIVMTMGQNTLVVKGYNSSDLSKPITQDSVVNVTGIASTTGGANALVPSKVAFVLNWKTDVTDVDLYSTDKRNETIYFGNSVASPGYLDHDNTTGYGPEVIAYRDMSNNVFVNGQFYVDVHYFDGSIATYYSIDVILNETDEANKIIRHYEAVQPLPYGDESDSGPTGSGGSRFNNVLIVNCNAEQVCGIGYVDSSKLSTLTVGQNSPNQSTSKMNSTSVEECQNELIKSLKKSGSVAWSCNSKSGAKIWH